jgi:hypothetical protein
MLACVGYRDNHSPCEKRLAAPLALRWAPGPAWASTLFGAVGLATLVLGLALVAVVGRLTLDGGDLAFKLALLVAIAAIFVAPGVVMVFERRGVTLDRRHNLATVWWGLLVLKLLRSRHSLSGVEQVRIVRIAGDRQGRRELFELHLDGRQGDHIVLGDGLLEPKAERFAALAASYLDLPIVRPLS